MVEDQFASVGVTRLMEPLTETLVQRFDNEPEAASRLITMGGELAVNLLLAALTLIATAWLSGFLSKLIKNGIARYSQHHSGDTTLSSFVGSIVRYGIWIIGLIAVFQQLGVQTTSILAVLGAASLAIGLALQGALSNVAAGVMLLVLRPYRVGDVVEIYGRTGTVRNLDLFVTQMTAADGLRLTVPNSKVLGEMIINYTTSGKRRMELHFGIDYEDDLDKALAVLLDVAGDEPRLLENPAPWARVTALQDSSVRVTLRAWTNSDDIGDAEADMIKAIKERFDAEGLIFPYPHQVGLSRGELKAATPLDPVAADAPEEPRGGVTSPKRKPAARNDA
jgi:small conductance mechanosensitive channel